MPRIKKVDYNKTGKWVDVDIDLYNLLSAKPTKTMEDYHECFKMQCEVYQIISNIPNLIPFFITWEVFRRNTLTGKKWKLSEYQEWKDSFIDYKQEYLKLKKQLCQD